ncbi:MAG TPA: hypothetical protein VGN63_23010 [Flavisolibacter sp.]|jgi:hypothetical protein|nr:hypothetical protein [Flavisolibacter sp.]
MDKVIPITFIYKGRVYQGKFEFIVDGSPVWRLIVNQTYFGHLMMLHGQWVFDTNTHEFEGMTDFFVDYLIAWIQ